MPDLSVEWEHQYLDRSNSVTSSLPNGLGGAFTVNGPALGGDSARIGAGFSIQLTDRVSTYLYYNGQYSQHSTSQSVNGGMSIGF
jgi:outer membrane autotransporter protein